MAEKVVVDCRTGESRSEPLTAEEEAQRVDDSAVAEALAALVDQRDARRRAAIDHLRLISKASSFTSTQRDNALRFTAKVLAAVLPFIDLDPS